MKIALIAILTSLAAFSSAEERDEFEGHKDNVDRKQFDRATLVVRARVTTSGHGSKYHWSDVTNIETLKSPKGIEIPKSFKVAFYSVGEPLPMGVSTLYLVRYNPDKPEYGWKLLQEFDSKKRRYTGVKKRGQSTHSNTSRAFHRSSELPDSLR